MKERIPMRLPIDEVPDSFNAKEKWSVQLRREREQLFPWERRGRPELVPAQSKKRKYERKEKKRNQNGEYQKILDEKSEMIIEDFRAGATVVSLQIKYKVYGKKLYQYLKHILKEEYSTIVDLHHRSRSSMNKRIQLP